jgi:hypothetical protein
MLPHRIERDRYVITKQQSSHGQGAAVHAGYNMVMVREYKTVEMGVMMQEKDIAPIDLGKARGQLRSIIPARGGIRPLDRRAMHRKARIADIRLGR